MANYALVALLLRVSNAARTPLPVRPAGAAQAHRRGEHRAGGAAFVNTPVRRIALAVMGMIVLLMANLTYVQVVKAGDYRTDSRNQRVLLAEYSRQRGQISAAGQVLASSKETGDRLRYQREYPDGPDVRADHRLLLGALQQQRRGARRWTRSSTATTTGCSPGGSRT